MHRIYRSCRYHRCSYTPESGCRCTEAHFLTFHITSRLGDAHFSKHWVAMYLSTYSGDHKYQEPYGHHAPEYPRQSFSVCIKSECEYHRKGQQYLRDHLHHIGQVIRIFKRMCRVSTIESTAISTQVLYGYKCGHWPAAYMHRISLYRGHGIHALECHWCPLEYMHRCYNDTHGQQYPQTAF